MSESDTPAAPTAEHATSPNPAAADADERPDRRSDAGDPSCGPAEGVDHAAIGRHRSAAIVVGIWLVAVVVAVVVLERQRAPRTFFFDEWAFVFDRRSWDVGAFLDAHNGHLSILPAAAFKALFSTFGLDEYRPYRIMGLVVHAAVASAVVLYVRARLGAAVALAVGVLVLFLGSGWQNVFWPFQIGYMGSVAAGVLAWWALDAETARRDRAASVLHLVALACSGLGIAIMAGTVARLAVTREWRRLVRVAVVPVLLYGAWYLVYGVSEGASDNIEAIPRYTVDSAAWSVAALGGRDLLWGRFGAGLLVGAGVVLAAVTRRVRPAVVAPAACAVVNWVLTGYSRAQLNDPGASRYVYVGAVFVVLVLADLLAQVGGVRLRAVVVALALLGVWGNWDVLRAGSGGLRETTAVTRSELRAVEWAASDVAPDYRPDTNRMPQVSAGAYLAAVEDLGSPAAGDAEVEVASETTRAEVDRVTLEISGLVRTPEGPHVLTSTESICRTSAGAGGVSSPDGSPIELDVPVGGAFEVSAGSAPVEVRLRRYASVSPVEPSARVEAFTDGSARLVDDTAPVRRWSVELRSTAPFAACVADAQTALG